jgi:type II secretory pathway pseudopilin PulG
LHTPSKSPPHISEPLAGRNSGFTIPELIAVLAGLCCISALVIVPLVNLQRRARLAACTENLHQISKAILAFAKDHKQSMPMGQADSAMELWWSYKEQVKSYLGLTGPSSPNDKVFACPGDRGYSDPKPFFKTPRFDFSSYPFNGVTVLGVPSIAGMTLGEIVQPQKTLLVMEWSAHAPLSWHKSRTGKRNLPFYCDAESVAGFVDGHVSFTKFYYDGYNASYTRDPIPGYNYKYSGK